MLYELFSSLVSYVQLYVSHSIDAPKNLEIPVEKGYALVETVFDSLDHLNTTMKENILKSKESYSTF